MDPHTDAPARDSRQMNLIDLIRATATSIVPGLDPDGEQARGALLLAEHVATTAAAEGLDLTSPAVAWVFCSACLHETLRELRAGSPDDLIIASEVPDADACDPKLAPAMRQLLQHIAALFATAASDGPGTPWRRLVWAEVACHLDGAVAATP